MLGAPAQAGKSILIGGRCQARANLIKSQKQTLNVSEEEMVEAKSQGKLHVEISAGAHHLESGVSRAQGGDDEAPSPHAILEASLAACTILTLELYAQRKAWNIGIISCQVRIEAENESGTVIARTLSFSESLTADMRERLEQIANKCPIHKLLSGTVNIHTKLIG
jgi:putative redox protein